MAKLHIAILLALICGLALSQNSDAAAKVFADAFNLPILPSITPSVQGQAFQASPNRFSPNQGSIYKAAQITVNREAAFNEIKNSAQKQKLPIKTVKSQ